MACQSSLELNTRVSIKQGINLQVELLNLMLRAMGLLLCSRRMAKECGVDLSVNPVVMVSGGDGDTTQ